jgi:ABC-type dipeptide/oligopeptide/nickel transport system ATPase subunit
MDKDINDKLINEKNIDKLVIKCNKDFRGFKEGEEFTIPIIPFVTYLVGPNGCGKSALLHYIRAQRDSLRDILTRASDGLTKSDDDILKGSGIFDIQGLGKYDCVFSLDSIDDDPMSFLNAATAVSFIENGAMSMRRRSKGQKAIDMLGLFLNRLNKYFDVEPKHNGVVQKEKKCLILLDEIDEGMDIKSQMKFDSLLTNIAVAYNADILCICHNPLCVCGSMFGDKTIIFDIKDRTMKTIGNYIKEQTGYTIEIKREKHEQNKTIH